MEKSRASSCNDYELISVAEFSRGFAGRAMNLSGFDGFLLPLHVNFRI
jgi:hypothetical protein